MDALFAKSVSSVFQVSLLALISVILIVWALRWAVEVCCAVDMGTAIQKKPSHANVSFVFDFLTTRQLGGVDEAMGGPTSSVAFMYLELGTVDSVQAGPTAVLVKERFEGLRHARFWSRGARGVHDPLIHSVTESGKWPTQ